MTETEHTPTPWTIHWHVGPHSETHRIVRADEPDIGRIATVDAHAPTNGDMLAEGAANAAFIVKAVNNHDELVAILTQVISTLNWSNHPIVEQSRALLERIQGGE